MFTHKIKKGFSKIKIDEGSIVEFSFIVNKIIKLMRDLAVRKQNLTVNS